MKEQQVVVPFRVRHNLQKRKGMVLTTQKNKPSFVLVVMEKNSKCSLYPYLTSDAFFVSRQTTILVLEKELRKRLKLKSNRNIQNDSLFIHTATKIITKDQKINSIYETQKNPQDGILYLQYSSVDPF